MTELLQANPWLLAVALGVVVPVAGIVFGTVTHYLQTVRLAELDASLKQAMLERGMSAEDIKMVLETAASYRGRKRRCGREAADWKAHELSR
jgi:hypothetical protein